MNQRILHIADLVKPGRIVADIGTDHAQLPVWLVEQGLVPKAYACDVAAGPLSAAEDLIHEHHLEDRITTILSDGFDNVPKDAQTAVIAGMGFPTARTILERAQDRLSSFSQIIVQVNNDTVPLRTWISEQHYTIDDECLIFDKGFWYTAVSFTTRYHESYTEEEILIGPVLLKRNDELLQEYAEHNISGIEEVMKKRSRQDEKQRQLQKELEIWKGIRKAQR